MVKDVDFGAPEMDFSRDIHPTDAALVIIGNDMNLRLVCQRWGYPGFQKTGGV